MNSAFFFIKPECNTESVRKLVQTVFESHQINILNQGSVSSEFIRETGIIDQHYSSISQLAISTSPSHIQITPDAEENFNRAFPFASSWKNEIASGRIFNAKEALEITFI
jgi:hypothetical protein